MAGLCSGSVVWARLGQSWWPGTVTTIDKCPTVYVQSLNELKKKPIAIVKFFNENEFQDIHKEEHIAVYNCDRKEEFIRKGQSANKNQKLDEVDLLKKFEADVVTAEKLTGGDMNIIESMRSGSVSEVHMEQGSAALSNLHNSVTHKISGEDARVLRWKWKSKSDFPHGEETAGISKELPTQPIESPKEITSQIDTKKSSHKDFSSKFEIKSIFNEVESNVEHTLCAKENVTASPVFQNSLGKYLKNYNNHKSPKKEKQVNTVSFRNTNNEYMYPPVIFETRNSLLYNNFNNKVSNAIKRENNNDIPLNKKDFVSEKLKDPAESIGLSLISGYIDSDSQDDDDEMLDLEDKSLNHKVIMSEPADLLSTNLPNKTADSSLLRENKLRVSPIITTFESQIQSKLKEFKVKTDKSKGNRKTKSPSPKKEKQGKRNEQDRINFVKGIMDTLIVGYPKEKEDVSNEDSIVKKTEANIVKQDVHYIDPPETSVGQAVGNQEKLAILEPSNNFISADDTAVKSQCMIIDRDSYYSCAEECSTDEYQTEMQEKDIRETLASKMLKEVENKNMEKEVENKEMESSIKTIDESKSGTIDYQNLDITDNEKIPIIAECVVEKEEYPAESMLQKFDSPVKSILDNCQIAVHAPVKSDNTSDTLQGTSQPGEGNVTVKSMQGNSDNLLERDEPSVGDVEMTVSSNWNLDQEDRFSFQNLTENIISNKDSVDSDNSQRKEIVHKPLQKSDSPLADVIESCQLSVGIIDKNSRSSFDSVQKSISSDENLTDNSTLLVRHAYRCESQVYVEEDLNIVELDVSSIETCENSNKETQDRNLSPFISTKSVVNSKLPIINKSQNSELPGNEKYIEKALTVRGFVEECKSLDRNEKRCKLLDMDVILKDVPDEERIKSFQSSCEDINQIQKEALNIENSDNDFTGFKENIYEQEKSITIKISTNTSQVELEKCYQPSVDESFTVGKSSKTNELPTLEAEIKSTNVIVAAEEGSIYSNSIYRIDTINNDDRKVFREDNIDIGCIEVVEKKDGEFSILRKESVKISDSCKDAQISIQSQDRNLILDVLDGITEPNLQKPMNSFDIKQNIEHTYNKEGEAKISHIEKGDAWTNVKENEQLAITLNAVMKMKCENEQLQGDESIDDRLKVDLKNLKTEHSVTNSSERIIKVTEEQFHNMEISNYLTENHYEHKETKQEPGRQKICNETSVHDIKKEEIYIEKKDMCYQTIIHNVRKEDELHIEIKKRERPIKKSQDTHYEITDTDNDCKKDVNCAFDKLSETKALVNELIEDSYVNKKPQNDSHEVLKEKNQPVEVIVGMCPFTVSTSDSLLDSCEPPVGNNKQIPDSSDLNYGQEDRFSFQNLPEIFISNEVSVDSYHSQDTNEPQVDIKQTSISTVGDYKERDQFPVGIIVESPKYSFDSAEKSLSPHKFQSEVSVGEGLSSAELDVSSMRNEMQKYEATKEKTFIKELSQCSKSSEIPNVKFKENEQMEQRSGRATKLNAILKMKYVLEEEQGGKSIGKRKKESKHMACTKKLKTENTVIISSEKSIKDKERNYNNIEKFNVITDNQYESKDMKQEICEKKRGRPKRVSSEDNIHYVKKDIDIHMLNEKEYNQTNICNVKKENEPIEKKKRGRPPKKHQNTYNNKIININNDSQKYENHAHILPEAETLINKSIEVTSVTTKPLSDYYVEALQVKSQPLKDIVESPFTTKTTLQLNSNNLFESYESSVGNNGKIIKSSAVNFVQERNCSFQSPIERCISNKDSIEVSSLPNEYEHQYETQHSVVEGLKLVEFDPSSIRNTVQKYESSKEGNISPSTKHMGNIRINENEQRAGRRSDRSTKLNTIIKMNYLIAKEKEDMSLCKKIKKSNTIYPKKLKIESTVINCSGKTIEGKFHSMETDDKYENTEIIQNPSKKKRGRPKKVCDKTNIHDIIKETEIHLENVIENKHLVQKKQGRSATILYQNTNSNEMLDGDKVCKNHANYDCNSLANEHINVSNTVKSQMTKEHDSESCSTSLEVSYDGTRVKMLEDERRRKEDIQEVEKMKQKRVISNRRNKNQIKRKHGRQNEKCIENKVDNQTNYDGKEIDESFLLIPESKEQKIMSSIESPKKWEENSSTGQDNDLDELPDLNKNKIKRKHERQNEKCIENKIDNQTNYDGKEIDKSFLLIPESKEQKIMSSIESPQKWEENSSTGQDNDLDELPDLSQDYMDESSDDEMKDDLPDLTAVPQSHKKLSRSRFKEGNIVWARHQNKWWPAYIKGAGRDGKASVRFINCQQTQGIKVNLSNIKSFHCDEFASFLNQQHPGFTRAVNMATSFLEMPQKDNSTTAEEFFNKLSLKEQNKLIGVPRTAALDLEEDDCNLSISSSLVKTSLNPEEVESSEYPGRLGSSPTLKRKADPSCSYSTQPPDSKLNSDSEKSNTISKRCKKKLESALKVRRSLNKLMVKFMKSSECLEHLWRIYNQEEISERHDLFQDEDNRFSLMFGGIASFHLDQESDNLIVDVIQDFVQTLNDNKPEFNEAKDYARIVWLPEAMRYYYRIVKNVEESRLDTVLLEGYQESRAEQQARERDSQHWD